MTFYLLTYGDVESAVIASDYDAFTNEALNDAVQVIEIELSDRRASDFTDEFAQWWLENRMTHPDDWHPLMTKAYLAHPLERWRERLEDEAIDAPTALVNMGR